MPENRAKTARPELLVPLSTPRARIIEDLLAERGIAVSYESVRLWCIKFGPRYAIRLKRRHSGYGDTFFIDEVFVKINGKQHYLWRVLTS